MFTFKRFVIDDAHSAMKVGTDGMLLGAWADVYHTLFSLSRAMNENFYTF